VTVIVTLPEATAVTSAEAPVAETVATVASLLDQVRFWLGASAGATVAASETVWPMASVALDGIKLTPVTAPTVTSQIAVLPPSTVVTVIVAAPAAMALTRPELETVATLGLPLNHVTARFVAFAGEMVAVSWSVSPGASWSVALLRATLLTGIGAVAVAVCVPVTDVVPVPVGVVVAVWLPVPVGVLVLETALVLVRVVVAVWLPVAVWELVTDGVLVTVVVMVAVWLPVAVWEPAAEGVLVTVEVVVAVWLPVAV
jgi:hypothetical protein